MNSPKPASPPRPHPLRQIVLGVLALTGLCFGATLGFRARTSPQPPVTLTPAVVVSEPMRLVAVAAQDIPKGAVITPVQVAFVPWPENIFYDALIDVNDNGIYDSVARRHISQSSVLFKSMFIEPAIATEWAIPTPPPPPPDQLGLAAFSLDEGWLAAGQMDGQVFLWDLHEPAAVARALEETLEGIDHLAFSPDSIWLAASGSASAWLWQLNGTRPPQRLSQDGVSLASFAFSPDSQWLATSDSERVCLWNLAAPGSSPLILIKGDDAVDALAFSPDSAWLATAGWSSIWLWDLRRGVVTEPQDIPGDSFAFGRMTDGGAWLAAIGDQRWQAWSLRGEQPISAQTFTASGGLWSPSILSPNGRWFVTPTTDGPAVWDLNAAGSTPLAYLDQAGGSEQPAFSRDGRWLAFGTNLVNVYSSRNWAVPAYRIRLDEGIEPTPTLAFNPMALGFSADGRWLAAAIQIGDMLHSGRYSGNVFRPRQTVLRLVDLETPGATPLNLPAVDPVLSVVRISPHGHWLAAAGPSGFFLYNLAMPQQMPRVLKRP